MSNKVITHQQQQHQRSNHHQHHPIDNSNIMDNRKQLTNINNAVSIAKHTLDPINSKIYVNNNNNANNTNKRPTYEELKRTRVVDKTYLFKLKEKRQRMHARNSTQPSTANVSGTKFDIGFYFFNNKFKF